MPFVPVACGKLYPDGSAHKSLRAGCGRHIPLFNGTCRFEKGSTSECTVEKMHESLGPRLDSPGHRGYEPVCDWLPAECVQAYAEASDDMNTVGGYFQSDLSWGLANVRSVTSPLYACIGKLQTSCTLAIPRLEYFPPFVVSS